jgi:hypothetical protein
MPGILRDAGHVVLADKHRNPTLKHNGDPSEAGVKFAS